MNDTPFSSEEILTLKVAEMTLHRDFVDTAVRSLLRGVRPASKAQVLVLRADLEELTRRCDDAANVKWPTSPTPNLNLGSTPPASNHKIFTDSP